MQCLNCGFENMPGLPACARCESALVLGEVSVVPMRASSLRLGTRLEQVLNQAGSVAAVLRRFRMPRWVPRSRNPRLWPSLIRTVIPGFGHMNVGHRVAGWILLIGWFGLLLAGLMTFPSGLTFYFFSAAIAIHSIAVISLFAEDLTYQGLAMRAAFGVLLFLGLLWLVYSPIGWVFQGFWSPMVVPATISPGQTVIAGDGVLYEGRWLRPSQFSRGELVVYRIPATQAGNYYSVDGYGIDRIVGVPGDTVEIREGRLFVNGATPRDSEMPLGDTRSMPNLELGLGDGDYAILPTRVRFIAGDRAQQSDVLRQITRTTDGLILGRLRYRLQPWSRFGAVH